MLPLVFAVVLNLLLQPALQILERLHVPRILAALLLILALFEAQCHGCAAHELGSGDGVCARKQGHLVTESDQFIREIGNNRSVPP